MHPDWRSRFLHSGCYVGIVVVLIGFIGLPILVIIGVRFLIAAAATIAGLGNALWAIIERIAISVASLILLAGIAILRGWEVALRWYTHDWHRGLVEYLYDLMS
jgi:hypothetical protein